MDDFTIKISKKQIDTIKIYKKKNEFTNVQIC